MRYFLRTREQYESAPVGTVVKAFALDGNLTKVESGLWARERMNWKLVSPETGIAREVIRWGSGIVFEKVSRTLSKVDR